MEPSLEFYTPLLSFVLSSTPSDPSIDQYQKLALYLSRAANGVARKKEEPHHKSQGRGEEARGRHGQEDEAVEDGARVKVSTPCSPQIRKQIESNRIESRLEL